jgi:hypothetical protein
LPQSFATIGVACRTSAASGFACKLLT